MTKKHKNQAQPAKEPAVAASGTEQGKPSLFKRLPWPYLLTFAGFYVFSTCVYGDIFRRTAEANFITDNSTQMEFLTSQAWGTIYCWGRWILCSMSNLYVGAALLSLILTLTAVLADKALCIPRAWRGVSALVPAAIVLWFIHRGLNIYYKEEPSLVFIVPIAALLVTATLALVGRFSWCRKRQLTEASPCKAKRAWGWTVPIVLIAALSVTALKWNKAEILTARMQMRMMDGDFAAMVDDALSCKRPTRSIAAYYTIGLVQTGQLLEHQFDIPYDFPEMRLKRHDGNEEYTIFTGDCSFYAGLINTAYRCAMDYTVFYGPTIYYLKRMAVCAILTDETALAKKYMAILKKVPFQNRFIEKYEPMIGNHERIEADEELMKVLALQPQEHNFEQNYRTPTFLGYNAGLLRGTDASLETAIAARLYSKELNAAMPLIRVYAQKHGGQLTPSLQQAITIMSTKDPSIDEEFGAIVNMQAPTFTAFITEAKPILDERKRVSEGKSEAEKLKIRDEYNHKLRAALSADWVGTYLYYYYCENNDQAQVKQNTQTAVN